MTREEFLSDFQNQRKTLLAIAEKVGMRRDSQGLPSAALTFAEALMLCPTLESATEQIKRDTEGARAFLDIAAFQEQHIAEIPTSHALKKLTATTPFFAVASAMQEYLLFLKKSVPERWI
jgi:hypothetical protein